jgi:hypothetical protein
VLAVELDGIDASLLLESVPSVEVDCSSVSREDHEDVGLSGCEARVVLAKQCAADPRALARIGVQRSGGQRLAKMHAMRPSGHAALGASNPAQPSRQSASPMSW